MKRSRTVIVFEEEQYDGEWIPNNAAEVLEWLSDKVNSIPEEFRDSALFEVDARSNYEDSAYASIRISYVRPETDEEEAKREDEERRHAERRRDGELRKLAELKAKYES